MTTTLKIYPNLDNKSITTQFDNILCIAVLVINDHSPICTSSSLVLPPGTVVPGAVAGASVSFGIMLLRYTSIFSPSRILKEPPARTPISCSPVGPTMPMEVLLMVNSLSCCNVSRNECNPCLIRSSRLPEIIPHQHKHVVSGKGMTQTVREFGVVFL